MDATVTLVIGMDSESAIALENAERARKLLYERYGLKIVVVPINTWISDPIRAQMMGIPRIYVNGLLVSQGKALDVNELVEFVLSSCKRFKEYDIDAIPAAIIEEGSAGAVELAL